MAPARDDATAEGEGDAPRAQHPGRRGAPRAVGNPSHPAEAHESAEPAPAGSLGGCGRPAAAPPHAGRGGGAALPSEDRLSPPPPSPPPIFPYVGPPRAALSR